MERFDLTGALPAPGATTVLEASAGTGKTFALAGLVTRYVAEGAATLDQMLLITFSRAASRDGPVSRNVAAACVCMRMPLAIGRRSPSTNPTPGPWSTAPKARSHRPRTISACATPSRARTTPDNP